MPFDRDGIDHAAIARMAKNIEASFARNPIRIPIQAHSAVAGAVHNYHAPVFITNGDNAQVAMVNNGKMVQLGNALT